MASTIGDPGTQASPNPATMVPEAAKKRKEIDEFIDDNDMTNLFLIALLEMQQEDPKKKAADKNEDWWTYYSLAGIHGLPNELWNNVKNHNDDAENPEGVKARGYCPHGTTVFPTWHRVYLNQFEEAILTRMRQVANEYKDVQDKTRYLYAAERFRLPFWDVFMPRNKKTVDQGFDENIFGVPKILQAEEVFVHHYNKDLGPKMRNPLYRFDFPSISTLESKGRAAWSPTDRWDKLGPRNLGGPIKTPKDERKRPDEHDYEYRDFTLRTPNAKGETNYNDDAENADKRRDGLNLKIRRQAKSQNAKLWKLLSTYEGTKDNKTREWMSFANHWVGGSKESGDRLDSSVSLESWHDGIHGLVGTGSTTGHMGDIALAAFDPIFWLHHNNIDRIFAIYQALYPDDSEYPDDSKDPKKWIDAKGATNGESPLYPFYKDEEQKQLWTSNDVKDWRKLGFAVPGNQYLDKKGRKRLETYLREQYYWATEHDDPPASISDSWPKNLEHSYALYGPNAKPKEDSLGSFEALTSAGLVTRTLEVTPEATLQPVDEEREIIFVDQSANEKLYPKGSLLKDPEHKAMRTWNAQILVEKFAFNGTFNVHVFLGDYKVEQAKRFFTKKNEVGYSTIFASQWDAPCANCVHQRQEHLIYEDAIPLTMAMTQWLTSYEGTDGPEPNMRTLQSLEPEHAGPFLKENLRWVVTTTSSEVIDNIDMIKNSQLEISVWDRIFDLPTEEHRLGLYHEATLHPDIATDHPGGLGYTYA